MGCISIRNSFNNFFIYRFLHLKNGLYLHKHLAARDVHHVLGNVAVFVGDHGRTAEVVGMVEVENWCRVGCGIGTQVSKQLQINAVAAERLVVHVVVEKSGLCCSRSSFLWVMLYTSS